MGSAGNCLGMTATYHLFLPIHSNKPSKRKSFGRYMNTHEYTNMSTVYTHTNHMALENSQCLMGKSSTKGISQPHNLTTIPRSVGRPVDVKDLNGSGKNAIKVKIPTCPTTDCFNETSTGNKRDFAPKHSKHLGFSMVFLQMFHEKNTIGNHRCPFPIG